MSLSRQLRATAEAAAADPNAVGSRRPARNPKVAEPARPLTQAQLNARLEVVSPVNDAEEEEEEEDVGRKKKARGRDDRAEEEQDEEGEVDEEQVEEEEEEAEAVEEGDALPAQVQSVEAEGGEDSGSDSDEHHNDEVLNPLLPRKKPKRKRKKIKERKKRSLGHFLVVRAPGGSIKCALCSYTVDNMRPDNIVRHWKHQHEKAFEAVDAANNSGRDVGAVVESQVAAVAVTVGSLDRYMKKKPRGVEQMPKIIKEVALLRWLIVSKVSFNTIDSDAFQDILTEWGVTLESKSTMLNLLTPMYEHVVDLTKEALAKCAGVATTFDLWTSCASRKYLAVTYHGIDQDWRLLHCVLDVIHFRGSTQSEVIAGVVQGCIEKRLPKDKLVTVVVSDGGADAKHAREDLLEYDGHDCFNHDLNLCLGDALKVAKDAAKDFASMEHLIREIESDKNLRIYFEKMQQIAGFDEVQKFVHRNDTRWTGLADSVAKFLKMRDAFFLEEAAACNQAIIEDWPVHLSDDVFQYAFWDRLRGYNDLLIPLCIATKLAQSLSVPTGSRVPKFISDMRGAWKRLSNARGVFAHVKAFGDALMECLSRRCDKYVNRPCNTVKAACLDPSQSRFLLDYGVSQEVIDQSWDAIVCEGKDEYLQAQKAAGDNFDEETAEMIVNGQVKILRQFLSKSTVPGDSDDPLVFYRGNMFGCTMYAPLACRVATNLLAIPAGESHSERVWSWAGGFVAKLRNRLADDTLQELVVMYDFFRSKRCLWEEFKESFARALRAAAERNTKRK
jgi:hypothetical protein